MGVSLSAQTTYFLWSLALGVGLGVLYDALRATRMVLCAGRIHMMISDILFFAVCGVLTALFALPFNKGDVRAFILFGEAVGFLAYRLTLGAVMGKVYAFLGKRLRSFVQKIRKIFKVFFDFLLKAIAFLLYNVSVVMDKLRKSVAERKQIHRAEKAQQRNRHLYKEQYHEQKRFKKTAYRVPQAARQRRRGAERR